MTPECISKLISPDSKISKKRWIYFLERLCVYQWAFVGGTVRDLILDMESRDIDIVVDCNDFELFNMLKSLNFIEYSRNRFGGYQIVFPSWKPIDVWPIRNTWAFEAGIVEVGGDVFASFLKTTFLDIDAVLIVFPDVRILSDNLFNAFSNGFIELNLSKNPSPFAASIRSICISEKYRLGVGPVLKNYIDTYLDLNCRKSLDYHERRYGFRRKSFQSMASLPSLGRPEVSGIYKQVMKEASKVTRPPRRETRFPTTPMSQLELFCEEFK